MDVSVATQTPPPAPPPPVTAASDEPDAGAVADVLLDQVDDTIGKIEREKNNLAPLERALEIALADLEKVREAGLATEKPDLITVYERAEAVAQKIVDETRAAAVEHAQKITELQTALRTILAELKKLDPENPLVQKL